VILVTGASRGLGLAICHRLLEAGHDVMGLARTPCVSASFRFVCGDVSDAVATKELAAKLKSDGTTLTAVINAAGIASMNLAVTTPSASVRKMVEVNLLGTIYMCQAMAPLMMRRKAGSIINFSTIAVPLGLKGESVYVASKAGVEGFSRAFAREMADFSINVNCIAPGPIDTDLIRGVSSPQIDKIVARQILPRQFTPSDVCDLVELLLDPRSA
jgi:3-oxoacyl-[acyl-carrier protein] reductase